MRKLADTAARRPGRQRCFEGEYQEAVDRLIAAYVDWREESIATREAYSRCDPTRGQKHGETFAVYFAAERLLSLWLR